MTDEERINILKNIKSIADVSYGENSRVSELADELICSYNPQKPEEEELDEKAAYREKVEQANREGKQIQYRPLYNLVPNGEWKSRDAYMSGTKLIWELHEYREKPQRKFIPWTVQTIPKGEPLTRKNFDEGVCFIPFFYGKVNIAYCGPMGDNYFVAYDELLKNFKRLDGTPCGDEVEA